MNDWSCGANSSLCLGLDTIVNWFSSWIPARASQASGSNPICFGSIALFWLKYESLDLPGRWFAMLRNTTSCHLCSSNKVRNMINIKVLIFEHSGRVLTNLSFEYYAQSLIYEVSDPQGKPCILDRNTIMLQHQRPPITCVFIVMKTLHTLATL